MPSSLKLPPFEQIHFSPNGRNIAVIIHPPKNDEFDYDLILYTITGSDRNRALKELGREPLPPIEDERKAYFSKYRDYRFSQDSSKFAFLDGTTKNVKLLDANSGSIIGEYTLPSSIRNIFFDDNELVVESNNTFVYLGGPKKKNFKVNLYHAMIREIKNKVVYGIGFGKAYTVYGHGDSDWNHRYLLTCSLQKPTVDNPYPLKYSPQELLQGNDRHGNYLIVTPYGIVVPFPTTIKMYSSTDLTLLPITFPEYNDETDRFLGVLCENEKWMITKGEEDLRFWNLETKKMQIFAKNNNTKAMAFFSTSSIMVVRETSTGNNIEFLPIPM